MTSRPNSISTFLSPRRWNLLKCLLFLGFPNTASTSCGRWLRYLRPSGDRSFSRSLSLIFLRRWFTCTILSDRLLWHRHLNGQALQLHALYLDIVCTKTLSVTRFASESLSILCPIGLELVTTYTTADGKQHVYSVEPFSVIKKEGDLYTFQVVHSLSNAGSFKVSYRMFPKNPDLPHRQDFCYVRWFV